LLDWVVGVVSSVGVGTGLLSIVTLLGWAVGVFVNDEVGVVSLVGVGSGVGIGVIGVGVGSTVG
jgi:hypothetical protein